MRLISGFVDTYLRWNTRQEELGEALLDFNILNELEAWLQNRA